MGLCYQNHKRKVHESENRYARNGRHSQAVQMAQFGNDIDEDLLEISIKKTNDP
jgi:hypothetical protein